MSQRFWADFFTKVCGVEDTLAAGIEFEFPVRKPRTDAIGWIDALWPGVVLIEHKSAGRSLDDAEEQAREYRGGLDARDRPPVIIVSDFFRFRVLEVASGAVVEFSLEDLPDHLARFEAILMQGGAGAARLEAGADAKAAELMADLYVAFQGAGYDGHEVSVFLMRCLFLVFGDDTGLWSSAGAQGLFQALVSSSSPDGAGLGGQIQELFEALDQPRDKRPSLLPESISAFPYVNGGLFADHLPVFAFTRSMRDALVAVCAYDWADISPAIFGAMFQNAKSKELRRELGEHYTSETNIMKVIGPLFLDGFNERLDREWDSAPGLRRFLRELSEYQWLDPACGCGNFLLVAYTQVRELELKIAARLIEMDRRPSAGVGRALMGDVLLNVKLHQFHGFELEEWSSQIARVAMLLAEHQANQRMERVLGFAPDLLPLSDAASIRTANALETPWSTELNFDEKTFIMGNPPFLGYSMASPEQKETQAHVWAGINGAGVLDFVTCWFLLAGRVVRDSGASCAFVATNSIAQGEQPSILWGELDKLGLSITFAHQSFSWANDSRDVAAVHTVIVGFASTAPKVKRLFTYSDIKGVPEERSATNINAYLVDGPNIIVSSRSRPLVGVVPSMAKGSIPTDDGHLSNLSSEDAARIRETDAIAARYLRPLIGAKEMLNGGDRWCLWLLDANPGDLRSSPTLRDRLMSVQTFRLESKKAKTREDAARPALFQEIRQPRDAYLALPRVSSERRRYLAAAYYQPNVICTDAVSIIENATLDLAGLIWSHHFWVWAQAVSGRLESRIRISGNITYNNFPFPEMTSSQTAAVAEVADGVLRARVFFTGSTLADLYDPLTMPPLLQRAHDALDVAVASALGISSKASDEEILAHLFERYAMLTSGPLFPTTPGRTRRGRTA